MRCNYRESGIEKFLDNSSVWIAIDTNFILYGILQNHIKGVGLVEAAGDRPRSLKMQYGPPFPIFRIWKIMHAGDNVSPSCLHRTWTVLAKYGLPRAVLSVPLTNTTWGKSFLSRIWNKDVQHNAHSSLEVVGIACDCAHAHFDFPDGGNYYTSHVLEPKWESLEYHWSFKLMKLVFGERHWSLSVLVSHQIIFFLGLPIFSPY